jgi:hypothetical protein
MNVIFLAYRDWALKVFPSIENHPRVSALVLCKTQEELLDINLDNFDMIISCGWSDELGQNVVSRIHAIGVHCAELDRYSYGTPIQLQILDGIEITKHRIFNFTYDKDSERAHTHNRMFSHEVDLNLSGNMVDILEQMTDTSIELFNMYLNDFPNIIWQEWPSEHIVRDAREPKDSRLTKEQFIRMDTKQLYDFFRCLESPYPNGYIEDDKGRLYIKLVGYKRND